MAKNLGKTIFLLHEMVLSSKIIKSGFSISKLS